MGLPAMLASRLGILRRTAENPVEEQSTPWQASALDSMLGLRREAV
jgi:hypothetical protein